MVPDRVRISDDVPSMIASAGGELVFTGARRSVFVDANRWPPQIVACDCYVLRAARSTSGRWMVQGAPYVLPRTTWWLRWYAEISATTHTLEEPEPGPARDLEPFLAELSPGRRRLALSRADRLDDIHMCGELAIAVPRLVGLGEVRRPFVRRGGSWLEETSLPALVRASASESVEVGCVRLDDGTDVVLWAGRVFEARPDGFTPCYDLPRETTISRSAEPVAARDRGMFVVAGGRLFELTGRGEARAHLPELPISGLRRGPGETLLLSGAETFLYDPRDRSAARIGRDLLGREGRPFASTDGGLVVFDQRTFRLYRLGADELAALPRTTEPSCAPASGASAAVMFAAERLAYADEALLDLVLLGRRLGFVTSTDLREHQPPEQLSAPDIARWLAVLAENGIEVRDEACGDSAPG